MEDKDKAQVQSIVMRMQSDPAFADNVLIALLTHHDINDTLHIVTDTIAKVQQEKDGPALPMFFTETPKC